MNQRGDDELTVAPNMLRMRLSMAIRDLERVGMKWEVESAADDERAVRGTDIVEGQSPSAGWPVPPGTRLRLRVRAW